MDDKIEIGKRIAACREFIGMNRSVLARAIDVSPQAVAQWEDGTNCPRGNNLRRLAEALNQSTQYLLHGDARVKAEGYYALDGFISQNAFEQVYKESIDRLVTMAEEFGWVQIKSGINRTMLADIGLSYIKHHPSMVNDRVQDAENNESDEDE